MERRYCLRSVGVRDAGARQRWDPASLFPYLSCLLEYAPLTDGAGKDQFPLPGRNEKTYCATRSESGHQPGIRPWKKRRRKAECRDLGVGDQRDSVREGGRPGGSRLLAWLGYGSWVHRCGA